MFQEYCHQKNGWDDNDYALILWKSVDRVCNRLDRTGYRQTSKIMNGWLPTASMPGHTTGFTQCPGCACAKETLGHMLQCPNQVMKKKITEILCALRKKSLKSQVPRRVL